MLKMRKVILMVLALAMVALTASAEIYPKTAKVIEVNEAEDLVTIETCTGITYTFEGCEDWTEGDGVSLIMEDNGTESILDDCILMAEYTGWTLEH